MRQALRSTIIKAIANRPHAFSVCLGLLLTSLLLIYNGLVDVPQSPRAGTEPVVLICLLAGVLGVPFSAWLWYRDVNDPQVLEAAIVLGLVTAMGLTIWTEHQWPDIASGTLGYAMLILVGAGAMVRNEVVLGLFLVIGVVAWLLVEGAGARSVDLPPDNRTLILASAAIAITFHVSLRFERHVQADLTEQLVDQIHNDALTGVLNREGMLRLVENRGMAEAPGWCLYADVDYFKSINDEFGHDRGDEVLCAVADAIGEVLGPDARVARWGGDEFVAIGAAEPPSEATIEARINGELESQGQRPRVTVGIAALDRAEGPADSMLVVEELVKSSDRRMYARRNEQRGGHQQHISRNH